MQQRAVEPDEEPIPAPAAEVDALHAARGAIRGPEGVRWLIGGVLAAIGGAFCVGYGVRSYFEGVETLHIRQTLTQTRSDLEKKKQQLAETKKGLEEKKTELAGVEDDRMTLSEELKAVEARSLSPGPLSPEVEPLGSGHDAEDQKVSYLRKAKHEIWFLGATFEITATHRRTLLEKALRRDVEIRILISDPEGKHFGDNAEMFGISTGELDDEWKRTIHGLRSLYAGLQPDARRRLQVRRSDHVFLEGSYIFDSRSEDAVAIIVPHVWGSNAPDSPAFRIRPGTNDVLKKYHRSAERLWAGATRVELATSPG